MNIKQSDWRLVNAPATIGENFNGAVIVPGVPLLFVSLIIKVPEINYLTLLLIALEIFRMKKKLASIKDGLKYIFFKYLTGHFWYGFRRSAYASLTSVAGALILFANMITPAYADFVVIRPPETIPNPNVVQQGSSSVDMKSQPLGGEFIDNRKIVKGAGPAVELEVLLKQIVPATYSIQFKSVEIASMSINWRSTNWTLDQVLGNISMRYGVMFETMQGSSVLSIDWFDERKCNSNENALFKRICGKADGFYD
jgi:hypothetical protein